VESHDEHAFFASMSAILSFILILIIYPRAKGSVQTIVAESTTLRRHIEANHLVSAF
jgi:hypothetical protein